MGHPGDAPRSRGLRLLAGAILTSPYRLLPDERAHSDAITDHLYCAIVSASAMIASSRQVYTKSASMFDLNRILRTCLHNIFRQDQRILVHPCLQLRPEPAVAIRNSCGLDHGQRGHPRPSPPAPRRPGDRWRTHPGGPARDHLPPPRVGASPCARRLAAAQIDGPATPAVATTGHACPSTAAA